jgi:hypothetical protein
MVPKRHGAFLALLASPVALVFGFARPCLADEAAAPLTVSRSPEAKECPDAPALADAIAQARGRPLPRRDAGAGGGLDIAFARGDTGYVATIRTKSGTRTLADAGPTCSPLAEAVVAAITVLLDGADAEPAPPEVQPPIPGHGSPPAEHPAVDASRWKLVNVSHTAMRIGYTLGLGYAHFHRTSSSPRSADDVVGALALRLHPRSQHGVVLGVTLANGWIFNAGYSLALLASRPLSGVSTGAYLDVGPALAIVSNATPSPTHVVLGGRAAATFDLHLGRYALGVTGAYQGGTPLGVSPRVASVNDAWEGAVTALVHWTVITDFNPDTRWTYR